MDQTWGGWASKITGGIPKLGGMKNNWGDRSGRTLCSGFHVALPMVLFSFVVIFNFYIDKC